MSASQCASGAKACTSSSGQHFKKTVTIFEVDDQDTDYGATIAAKRADRNNATSATCPPQTARKTVVDICPGINCDHDAASTRVPALPFDVNSDIDVTLTTFIEMGESYHCKLQRNMGDVCLRRVAKLRSSLIELQNVIGMNSIKKNFSELVTYFLTEDMPNKHELLHTVITGPPGVGKSHVIGCLAKIYVEMGYLTKRTIHYVNLTDLKGEFVGKTAQLTQKAIDAARGGVLVIDEAYAIASADKVDSFSKEIIDVLNKNLTERAGEFICIIAGYEQQIQDCIFAHNPGMASRFRFKFAIPEYTSHELQQIFASKLQQGAWKYHADIDAQALQNFFLQHHASYRYFGRDMETLLFHVKLAHSKRMLFQSAQKNMITMADMQAGQSKFSAHDTPALSTCNIDHIYI